MNMVYARKSIGAAWLLFVRDQNAWKEFDLSVDGFFKSFAVVLLVIPFNAVFDLFSMRLSQERAASEGLAAGDASYSYAEFLFSSTALCIEWLLFPVIAYFLLRLLALSDRYLTYIVAHNWGRVIIELFNLPGIVLFSLGVIPYSVAIDLLFMSLGLTLYYRFYIAQTALEVGWVLAMGVAVVELLLSFLFMIAVSRTAFLWLPA